MRYRLVLTALLPCTAFAAGAPAPEPPRLEYRPALADYHPYREVELADWRAVNDLVGRLGGHLGHSEPPGKGQGEARPPVPQEQTGGRP